MPKLKDGQLSQKQRRFIDFFMGEAAGNATRAAELAGYSHKTAHQIGAENIRKPQIAAAIEVLVATRPEIATREERQTFWSQFMRDQSLTAFERYKASELLGRSHGDFIDRTDHSGEVKLRVSWAGMDRD